MTHHVSKSSTSVVSQCAAVIEALHTWRMTNNTVAGIDFPLQLLIDGIWRDSSGGSTFTVTNPATGEGIAEVASATADNALDALASAHASQLDLKATTPQQRSDFLQELYSRVIEAKDSLARVMTAESGKPLAESKVEVQYAADYLRWFAGAALRSPGQTRTAPAGHTITVRHKPVGPSYLITPWNFPLAMITRKFAPALAAGCTTIIKPASATPLTTLYFAHLALGLVEKYDLPTGAFNVLPTKDSNAISGALLTDPRLRKLSFTGSTEVGGELLAQAAPNILRTSMELGGNAPFIVCEDADIDAAVAGAMAAKMRNAGQTCVAANRFIVHKSVAREFTEKLKAEFEKLVVAPGDREGSTVGPLISQSAVERVRAAVQESTAFGATLEFEHDQIPDHGSFYPPTILTTNEDDPLLQQEIFGPVAPIVTFDTLEHAIHIANDTPFGLVAYAYTRSASAQARLENDVEAGMIGINRAMVSDATAPFGGIKHSGVGREGGHEGLLEYLEPFYIAR